jgi:hypothetical protein
VSKSMQDKTGSEFTRWSSTQRERESVCVWQACRNRLTMRGMVSDMAKWGIVGLALAWLWSNALSPLLKKFGVF